MISAGYVPYDLTEEMIRYSRVIRRMKTDEYQRAIAKEDSDAPAVS